MRLKRRWLPVFGLVVLGSMALAPGQGKWAGWHFPLPAGEWLISRGPCNSPSPYDHGCDWYEDRCAIDVIAAKGPTLNQPVLAPAAGAVLASEYRVDAGNTLMIQHPDGRVSVLMHLSRLAVRTGEPVALGQVVGYIGSSGRKTRVPHLHFHVLANARTWACESLEGLDWMNLGAQRLVSANLAWDDLILVNPPPGLALTPAAQARTSQMFRTFGKSHGPY